MKLRTLNEAAEALGVSRRQLQQGIQAGKYPSIKWGNRTLIDLDAMTEIVEAERERCEGLVDLRTCAEAIGVSQDALRRMAKAGLVPYRRDGRRYVFDIEKVAAAIRAAMKP